jgi:hypothetical protein
MIEPWSVIGWLPLSWLTACVASQTEGPMAGWSSVLTYGSERPALDRFRPHAPSNSRKRV